MASSLLPVAYREVGLAMIGDALAHDLLRFGLVGRIFGTLLCALEDHRRGAASP